MTTARRRLLACIPAAGLVPAAAGAFRLEAPTAEIATEYGASACDRVELHAALRGELDGVTGGRPVPPEVEARLIELTRCPFCGCAVAGAPDHGEGRAEPG